MAHVGDIGRGGGRRGFGEGTRIGPAPTAEGSQSSPLAGDSLGGDTLGLEGGGEGLLETGDGGGPGLGLGLGRTGERPALRTGERPTLRTGERPSLGTGTGERPVLSERGQPRTTTTTRPSAPAATFADALTQDKGGKLSTAPETLVLPKTPEPPPMTRGGKTREMPAFRDARAQTGTPASSPEGREGRTVSDMDSPVRRSGDGTRIVRMTDVQAGRTRTEGGEELRRAKGDDVTRVGQAPTKDDFGATQQSTANKPAFRASQVKVPVRPVQDLIPPGLGKLADQTAVAKRFAADLPLLHQQVRPSSLPPGDRALRAWAFFTAYAEAAAAQKPTPEGKQIFDKALKEQGFGQYRDKQTGQDGVKVAKWVLESTNPEQARERAGQVEIEPLLTLEQRLSEAAQLQDPQRKQQPGQTQEAIPKQELAQAQESPAKAEAQRKQPQEAPPKPEAAPPKPEVAQAQEAPARSESVQVQETPARPETAQAQESPRKLEEGPRTETRSQPQELQDSAFIEGPERPPLERVDGKSEFVRVNPQVADNPRPVMQPVNPEVQRREDEESTIGRFDDAWKKMSGSLRLGSNMLWNVLHRFRNGPEDSAIEKEKWNQLVFAAMLAFVGLMLLVILVVSL